MSFDQNEPQIKITGHIKEGSRSELYVFTIPIGRYIELPCIVNIPGEGENNSLVYVKARLRTFPINSSNAKTLGQAVFGLLKYLGFGSGKENDL
jgi:hypothetical protein